ncbi:MAG TPA: HD family phosphohydrolase [Deltaproteobacteria bacterium]|nr:HD family phosphohydrolase [Deltaproteobacteria bacterium]
MKKTFIKDLKEKEQVSGAFLVTKKESGVSKSGKPYLNMKIMDSTGECEARVWEAAEEIGRVFQKNDIVSVKGFAVAYQGGLQVNITSVSALPEDAYSIRDFLPASQREPVVMVVELESVINGMTDRHLKALLHSIFSDKDIRDRFMTAPAAKAMHHPYLGGLLEHVLSICGLADKVVGHYKEGINRDLLLTGAILHDIGKIYELSYKRGFDYTDEGRLLGHITIGVELIDERIRLLKDFPRETAVLLKHMLLSHHGHLEFGSPKRPKTIEAIILYYLDDMDAKINAVKTLIDDERDSSNWTPYQRIFERYIFKGEFRPDEAPVGPLEDKRKDEKPGDKAEGVKKDDIPSLF